MRVLLLLLFPLCLNAQIDFDKRLHFRNGVILSGATYCLIENTNNKIKHPSLVCFGVGAFAGLSKEAYDYFSHKGVASYEDLLFTMAGSFCVTIVIKQAIKRKGMPEPVELSIF